MNRMNQRANCLICMRCRQERSFVKRCFPEQMAQGASVVFTKKMAHAHGTRRNTVLEHVKAETDTWLDREPQTARMEARLHEGGALEDEDKQKGPRGVDSPLPTFGKLAPSIARTKLLFPTDVPTRTVAPARPSPLGNSFSQGSPPVGSNSCKCWQGHSRCRCKPPPSPFVECSILTIRSGPS
jgi:hypothetical protein